MTGMAKRREKSEEPGGSGKKKRERFLEIKENRRAIEPASLRSSRTRSAQQRTNNIAVFLIGKFSSYWARLGAVFAVDKYFASALFMQPFMTLHVFFSPEDFQ